MDRVLVKEMTVEPRTDSDLNIENDEVHRVIDVFTAKQRATMYLVLALGQVVRPTVEYTGSSLPKPQSGCRILLDFHGYLSPAVFCFFF